jgi:hypothetical protein
MNYLQDGRALDHTGNIPIFILNFGAEMFHIFCFGDIAEDNIYKASTTPNRIKSNFLLFLSDARPSKENQVAGPRLYQGVS